MTHEMLNGVDIDEVINSATAMNENAELGQFQFRVHNEWVNGGHNHSSIRNFYGANQENNHVSVFEWEIDEPPLLSGGDLGANPTEYLLSALSSCMTTTLVYHAALRGIRINRLESEIEGDIDLRGFMGISSEVRKGYKNIRMTFKVDTDEENLRQLKELCKLSPVYDIVTNGTDVDVWIEKMGSAAH